MTWANCDIFWANRWQDGLYTLDLLKTGMMGCKPCETPIDPNHRFSANVGEWQIEPGKYQHLVSRFIYLTLTRPDITCAIVKSQFVHAATTVHLAATYQVLHYLKWNPATGLLYTYNAVDWTESVSDQRSTSGYSTFVGSNLVTQRNKKQFVVARLSAKAEFKSKAHGVCELLQLQILLFKLGFSI